MTDKKSIERVARRIAEIVKAKKIILFGSYARGEQKQDSDVDLLVVADSVLPRFKRSKEIYRTLIPYPFPMDILIYTPLEIEKELATPVSFISRVFQEGQIVYAA